MERGGEGRDREEKRGESKGKGGEEERGEKERKGEEGSGGERRGVKRREGV